MDSPRNICSAFSCQTSSMSSNTALGRSRCDRCFHPYVSKPLLHRDRPVPGTPWDSGHGLHRPRPRANLLLPDRLQRTAPSIAGNRFGSPLKSRVWSQLPASGLGRMLRFTRYDPPTGRSSMAACRVARVCKRFSTGYVYLINNGHTYSLYFSEVDEVGHRVGPDSPELASAVRRAD